MQFIIYSPYLDAQLPMPSHTQITAGAKTSFIIGLQIDRIGSHIHIKHSGVDRDANIGGGLAATISNLHCEDIGAKTVWRDIDIDGKELVACRCCCSERL